MKHMWVKGLQKIPPWLQILCSREMYRRGVIAWMSWEVISWSWGNEAWVALKTQQYWLHQICGLSTKDRTVRRECNQPEWEERRKAGLMEATKSFGVFHESTWIGVCFADFQSCCGPVFSHCADILPFWNGNIYSMLLYIRTWSFTL